MARSSFLVFSLDAESFLFGVPVVVVFEGFFQNPQSVDGRRHCAPVGHHAAQPTIVDVVLLTAFCLCRDDGGCPPLCRNEQDTLPAGSGLA